MVVSLSPLEAGGDTHAIVTRITQTERDLQFEAAEFDIRTVLKFKFLVKEKFDERWQGPFLQRMFHLDRPV